MTASGDKAGDAAPGEDPENSSLQLQLVAKGDIKIGAELSQRHQMYFILSGYSKSSVL